MGLAPSGNRVLVEAVLRGHHFSPYSSFIFGVLTVCQVPGQTLGSLKLRGGQQTLMMSHRNIQKYPETSQDQSTRDSGQCRSVCRIRCVCKGLGTPSSGGGVASGICLGHLGSIRVMSRRGAGMFPVHQLGRSGREPWEQGLHPASC
jgi:hypothetical protein